MVLINLEEKGKDYQVFLFNPNVRQLAAVASFTDLMNSLAKVPEMKGEERKKKKQRGRKTEEEEKGQGRGWGGGGEGD